MAGCPHRAGTGERIRDANLRQGLYSEADETALQALGEDPEVLRQLLAGSCSDGL